MPYFRKERNSTIILRYIRNILLVLVAMYVSALAALYFMQRDMVFEPDTSKPDPSAYGVSDLVDIISVQTADGLELQGWLFSILRIDDVSDVIFEKPSSVDEIETLLAYDEVAPLIVFFHGNARHHGNRAKDARRLMSLGYDVLLASYRGFGGNAGDPTEEGLYKDARAWADWALSRQSNANQPVIFYGESLGTAVASKMAAEYEVQALILETPMTSVADVAAERYPYFPVKRLTKDKFDTLSRMSLIAEPVLIMGAGKDKIVPVEHSRILKNAAKSPAEMIIIEDGHHSNLHEFEIYGVIDRFLERYISQK